MCSGNLPAAPESADLIAIIHPTQHQPEQYSTQRPVTYRSLSGRLRLSNQHHPSTTTTEFQHTLPSAHFTQQQELLTIQIHKFGQPIPEPCGFSPIHSNSDEPNPILHSFPVSLPLACSSDRDVATQSIVGLGRRLDFGVGGEGIVGRTVSVVNCEGGLLGQGIIGRI